MDLPEKRICVTGGAGFLGSFLVETLRARGCRDIFVPRRREYDLTAGDAVDRLFADASPQVIFHLAATVGGIGANQDNPGRFFYENAMMGMLMIEAARRHRVEKIIVAGSVCSYPKLAAVPLREPSLWEGFPEETNAPYGIAKKAVLMQCQAYRRQYGTNAVFLLLGNLYGPRDHFDLATSHVIPAIIRKSVEARDRSADHIVCWGDGSPTREFLYAADAAEALALAAERYDGEEPVNLGTGEEISIRELTGRIVRMCGYRGEIRWDCSKPNGQPRRSLDISRAEREFGFRATTSLEDGLRRTIQWYETSRAKVHPRA